MGRGLLFAPALAAVLLACGGEGTDGTDRFDAPADAGTTDGALDDSLADPGTDGGGTNDGPVDDGPVDVAPDVPPDAAYPVVAIASPAVGTFLDTCNVDLAVLVQVDSADPLASVRLGDRDLEPRTGEQQALVKPGFGLTVLDVEARTTAGAVSREHRSVMCGTWTTPEKAVAHAADLYLGRDALAALARIASRWLDGPGLTALLAARDPLYESSFARVTPGPVETGPGATLTLLPLWGYVAAALEIPALRVQVEVELFGSPSRFYTVVVRADPLRADARVDLRLDEAGAVVVDVSELVFDFVDLEVSVSGIGDDLLAAFPEYRETLVDGVESWLADTLRSYIPAATEAALGRLSDPVTLSLLGEPFTVRFRPSVLTVEPKGVHLALDVAVEGLEPDPDVVAPGVLWTPGQEAWPAVDGVRLSIKDDLVNALLHEAWRSGLARLTVDQAFLDARKVEVDLVAGFLGGALSRLPGPVDPETRIALAVQAPLPPVASLDLPVQGGIRLGIGDVRMDVRAAGDPVGPPLLSLSVTIRMEGEVRATGPSAVEAVFGTLDVALDVVDDDGTFAATEGWLEDTTAGLLDSVGPLLNGMLGAIPVPAFGGASLANVRVGTDRLDGGVIVVEGDLVQAGGAP